MGKRTVSKAFHKASMDILSVIYQETLRVNSTHSSPKDARKRQYDASKRLVAKHGVGVVLESMFFAYLTMARQEKNGQVPVSVGKETFNLYPFFEGMDLYFHERWPVEYDTKKQRVWKASGQTLAWANGFLNYPYRAPNTEATAPKVDLSDMSPSERLTSLWKRMLDAGTGVKRVMDFDTVAGESKKHGVVLEREESPVFYRFADPESVERAKSYLVGS